MRRAGLLVFVCCLWLAACAPASLPPGGVTGSVGRPDNGRLIDGVQLVSNEDLLVLEPAKAWGTQALVDLLLMTAREMRLAYPDTVPLLVGHLSLPEGGSMSPHRSHQSGRDVDLGLYMRDNKPTRCFATADRDQLDVQKNWYLIDTLIASGLVQYVFLDWEVQKIIYDEVQISVPQQQLDAIFQYPRPRGTRQGIVRHADGHANHLHVRIHCPDQDTGCLED